MDNVLELFEQLGSNSKLQNIDQRTIEAINAAHLDEDVKKALADKDFATLEMLLETKFKIYCLLFPAKDDDEESTEDDSEKEDPDKTQEKSNQKVFA